MGYLKFRECRRGVGDSFLFIGMCRGSACRARHNRAKSGGVNKTRGRVLWLLVCNKINVMGNKRINWVIMEICSSVAEQSLKPNYD